MHACILSRLAFLLHFSALFAGGGLHLCVPACIRAYLIFFFLFLCPAPPVAQRKGQRCRQVRCVFCVVGKNQRFFSKFVSFLINRQRHGHLPLSLPHMFSSFSFPSFVPFILSLRMRMSVFAGFRSQMLLRFPLIFPCYFRSCGKRNDEIEMKTADTFFSIFLLFFLS